MVGLWHNGGVGSILSTRTEGRPILVPVLGGYTVFEKQYSRRSRANEVHRPHASHDAAELGQRSLDTAWTADFPPEGRFAPATLKGRKYW